MHSFHSATICKLVNHYTSTRILIHLSTRRLFASSSDHMLGSPASFLSNRHSFKSSSDHSLCWLNTLKFVQHSICTRLLVQHSTACNKLSAAVAPIWLHCILVQHSTTSNKLPAATRQFGFILLYPAMLVAPSGGGNWRICHHPSSAGDTGRQMTSRAQPRHNPCTASLGLTASHGFFGLPCGLLRAHSFSWLQLGFLRASLSFL